MSSTPNDEPTLHRVTREMREARERDLSPLATRVVDSRGRAEFEPPDALRTAFEVDRDRIVHSKAFRRLKHKTQVFINPEGDHIVTRMSHTQQVTQIGRAIARALALNEDLTEAICLGHDCGHTPFGHTGEAALSEYVDDGEWLHSTQGVRVFSVLEPRNLSWEVLDGIRAHTWRVKPPPSTAEGWACRFADRIAYLNHDLLDAVRADVLRPDDLPTEVVRVLGRFEGGRWIGVMIDAVIDESLQRGKLSMTADVLGAMRALREFMFERVYLRPESRKQAERARRVVHDLVDHLLSHPDELPDLPNDSSMHVDDPLRLRVLDYVAGMTDRFALNLHDRLFRPRGLA
ncbi:MAG: HD domain-containing protein [Wenzhouxiangellaceae bacterium]|nr:HD domain-containing protein [Wenzhouxiangellaceae bacterium]